MDALITCCSLLLFNILYVGASLYAYKYSKDKYKHIRREWRLLDGLLQDFDEVLTSVNQIMQKASELMEYSDIKKVTELLEEKDNWISKAREVVREGNLCFQRFQELREKRNSSKWFVSFLIDMPPVVDVAYEMPRIEKRIKDHLGRNLIADTTDVKEKVCVSDIYELVENSRSKVRSVQERSVVDEREHQSLNSTLPPIGERTGRLISSLTDLKIAHPKLTQGVEEKIELHLMHLHLLQTFTEDLKSVNLESKLEISWEIEASETIDEAKDAIDAIHRKANRRRWITDFRQWTDRWKLKDELMDVGTWISGLMEIKERYGFIFIRRDRSRKQILQYQTTDDTDLSSAVNNICKCLTQLTKVEGIHIHSLRKELEDMHKYLKETKATDYASNLRNACLVKLKEIAAKIVMKDSKSKLPSEVKQIKEVVKLLHRCIKETLFLTPPPKKEHSVISIVGMKGIGKTTLAKKVFYDRRIRKHFDVQGWVSIPHEAERVVLFTSIRNPLTKKEREEPEEREQPEEPEELEEPEEREERVKREEPEEREKREEPIGRDCWIQKVLDFLNTKEKRCLLVLDNVSSMEEWNSLTAALQDLNGSRVVVTTTSRAVALASHVPRKNSLHQLRLRTKEESWEIFTQRVHYRPGKMESHAKEVVGRGGGLPLAIIDVGNRLSGREEKSKEFFMELERITQGKNRTPWSDTVAENIKELESSSSAHLSKCFYYFQLFSRDFEIPVRRIVSSWIAQEFVQVKGDQNLEEVAYECLSELIGRNMIQVVQRKPDGKVKTCCLPTTVRDPLLQDQGNSRETRSSFPTTSKEGKLAFHLDGDNDASFSQSLGPNTNAYPHCILFFDTREGNKPGEDIGEFILRSIDDGSFRKLQVLDLERVFRPQLPTNIGKLKQLAYLGLRLTYLETIPDSVGDLVNLQTLDLKHTYVQTLPGSVWKLKKLRHLYLNQSCQFTQPTDFSIRNFQLPQPSGISMKNLQILSGVFVDNGSPLKDGLSKLTNLRKLGLAFQLKEQEVLETWIAKLSHLKSLRLRSINEKREAQPLKLKSIPDLKKLSSLYLFGTIENPSIIINYELPKSLTHLTLSASGIKEDPMPKLGKLPNLRSLSLYSGSYEGAALTCTKDSFPQLLVLKLWKLDTLENLDVQEGAVQKLRELDIRSCKNLTISIVLTHLKTLQEFKVS
ncbi:hypothetical protein L3X38_041520 [Prunus dulcis]|uniref:NB-ARC domain-containing disease resistance protein n=1 Tax=Prunus dulcis TaxID=3755 RepID=A0AAD4UV30_PRUDU|nr:hypothetical protein L3X38_041520 [Prunus dulcis]